MLFFHLEDKFVKIRFLTGCTWGLSLFITVNLSFAQNGDRANRKWGFHDANKINTGFRNYGMIGNWPNKPHPTEYPKGSGRYYLEGATIIIAAEIVDVNGDTVHTIVTNFRERIDYSPEGVPQTFEPLPGFDNPAGSSIAMSHLPASWPPFWPDKSEDTADPGWPGSWNGFFGKNVFRADQESYFVMDDDKDDEFDFFPDSTDSSRRGLGLRVGVRGLQWSEFLAEDIIFWHYTITNEGTTNYDKLIFGSFFIPEMGGGGLHSPSDAVAVDPILPLVYAWDTDHTGPTGYSPLPYMGFILLEDPGNVSITSVNVTVHGVPSLREDEKIWALLTNDNFSIDIGNSLLQVLFGSGFFSLNAGESKTAAMALVFGEDLDDLIRNASFARSFYNGEFDFNKHDVSIGFPIGGETLSGSIEINWSARGAEEPLQVDIYTSFKDGRTWTLLAENEPDDGAFTWDTTTMTDGIYYRLWVVVTNDEGVGMSLSDTTFTINNSFAAAPQVILQSPVGGEDLSGSHNITWKAGDADGDGVTLTVWFSNDGGETFDPVSTGEANDGQFEWDTTLFPNGSNYRIKLVVSDGALMGEDQSNEAFRVNNPRSPLSDFYPDTLGVAHTAGPGTGKIQVNIVGPPALTDHIYEISFDDANADKTIYDVFDLSTGELVVAAANEVTPEAEGPLFDGIRLLIEDDLPIRALTEQSRWIAGDSNYKVNVENSVISTPFPADYEIRFFAEIVDMSNNGFPTNFTVYNVTDSRKTRFDFFDGDRDGVWGAGESIIIREMFKGREKRSWRVRMIDTTTVASAEPPEAGDIFFIRTAKPFRSGDIFRFPEVITSVASRPDETLSPLTYELFQNYPNPFNPETTIQYSLAVSGRVTIHIYNILGQRVRILVDDVLEVGVHKVQWDGKDEGGRNIASGVYVYRVRSGDFVQTRKLLLLR